MTELSQKKRGRKKKEVVSPKKNQEQLQQNNITITIEEKEEETPLKKRGRKPKGGKLVIKQNEKSTSPAPIANIILHLKCSMNDLNEHNVSISKIVTDPMVYNPDIPPNILSYNANDTTNFMPFENNVEEQKHEIKDVAYSEFDVKPMTSICQKCAFEMNEENKEEDSDINIKDINAKLKKLKIQLYKNSNHDKKSACFWCTYEYDSPSCYIPKYEMDMQIYGYGSFCRPECAVAYLMKENIDDSTKFERYHLLNQIYSKVYDFKKNIKPAPNPYYLLDKYYGNLSIQEYRKLLKSEHMLLVIDKPLTRILPELHEDNDEFISNIFGSGSKTTQSNQTGMYKVKRESDKQKGPTKSSIIKDRFGITN